MSWPRGGPGRPAHKNPVLTPEDRASLVALFREIGAIHMHLHRMTHTNRWLLAVTTSRLCGTERCAWIKLR